MKIIDLLNKIANGEEVPKKIAIQNDVLIYNEKYNLYLQDYYCMSDEENATWKIWAYRLNDEVEILDKENKIEKCIRRIISHNFCITDNNYKERFEVIRKSIEDNANEIEYTKAKINELIDEVNKLKENK